MLGKKVKFVEIIILMKLITNQLYGRLYTSFKIHRKWEESYLLLPLFLVKGMDLKVRTQFDSKSTRSRISMLLLPIPHSENWCSHFCPFFSSSSLCDLSNISYLIIFLNSSRFAFRSTISSLVRVRFHFAKNHDCHYCEKLMWSAHQFLHIQIKFLD